MRMFKELSPKEVTEYKKWARENYKPLNPISGIYHPVVQQECVLMNEEYNRSLTSIDAIDAINDLTEPT